MVIKYNFLNNINNKKTNSITVVADNNKNDLLFVGFVMDSLKLEYYLADNGKTALDLVYEKKPKLVLLNVAMPYLSGVEANILIKNDLFTKHISTIAITRLTEQEHIKAIKNAQFDDYIVKPFTTEDLKIKIRGFIK